MEVPTFTRSSNDYHDHDYDDDHDDDHDHDLDDEELYVKILGR